MKRSLLRLMMMIFTITCAQAEVIVNFVRNPDFEQYSKCPDAWNQIVYCVPWSIPKDSISIAEYNLEYYNSCGNSSPDLALHIPDNSSFWQFPHSGNGMARAHLYNDKTTYSSGLLPYNYRDNLVGRLYDKLLSGRSYCVRFWVNLAEASGVAHNKIGAYLDDGTINKLVDTLGQEITTVKPQVYTNTILDDTANWVKIEGSFVATGKETHITIGNFFPNDSVSTRVTNYWFAFYSTSYYLIDDVSVIPIDLDAKAGADTWVPITKTVQIGRVGDTTAKGLDCKWYHKGVLIDSGAIITIKAAPVVNVTDTYVVVQTICGLVKRDTVNVRTTGLGVKEYGPSNTFSIYPNPSNGIITITSALNNNPVSATVYDVLGRIITQQDITFTNNQSTIQLREPAGSYILVLQDEEGNTYRQQLILQ